MDKVFIEGLEIEALIGIYDWERRIRQPLRFDIEMAFDNRVPAASDRIADTLDYKAVSKRLIAFVSQSGFGLVETLAERCAALILDEFKVDKVKLKLSKPGAVRGAQAVGVIIKRKRADTPGALEATAATSAKPAATAAPRPATTMPAAQAAIPGIPPARPFVPVWTAIAAKPPGPPPKGPPTAPAPEAPKPAPGTMRASVATPAIAATPPSPAGPASTSAATALQNSAPDPTPGPTPAPAASPATTAATATDTIAAPRVVAPKRLPSRFHTTTRQAYLSLGSNIAPEVNLTRAVAALRARFGEVVVSPVYRTPAVGFRGPDFLNAIAVIDSDIHPFALNDWLHALELKQGRDRRDASYSDRTLDIDIIYFGDLVLDGPGDFQLPRPELHHAFVLKPLADVAPTFVDPVRRMTLERLWAAHPEFTRPPQRVPLEL